MLSVMVYLSFYIKLYNICILLENLVNNSLHQAQNFVVKKVESANTSGVLCGDSVLFPSQLRSLYL